MKKRLVGISFIIIIVLLFLFINYKIRKNGNTIGKSTNDIVENILNCHSYTAKVTVDVYSNKTRNQYILKQILKNANNWSQTIEEPEVLKGLLMMYDGQNLTLSNTKLSLTKLYTHYPYIHENALWLSSVTIGKETRIEEKQEEIIVENKIKNHPYHQIQRLIINKKTGMPKKLEILDNNQNIKIYIHYNEIQFNN